MAPSSHQPSTTKLLVIFIVASLSILAINDLVLFEGLKNSMKQEAKKFEKTMAAAGGLEGLESKLKELVGAQLAGLLDEAMTRLNKEGEKLDAAIMKSQAMNEQTNKLIEEMRQKIEEVDINKSEANFTFKFENVTDFLGSNGEMRRSDESVYLRGIAFDLKLNTKTNLQNDRYLAITLTANSPFDHVNFSMELTYDLRLVNQLQQEANRTDSDRTVLKKAGNKVVWSYFITIEQLMSDGFIVNDTIVLETHLKCDKFMRLD